MGRHGEMQGHHGGGRMGHHRGRGHHRGAGPEAPTLSFRLERPGNALVFECNAPMQDCLDAIDRIRGLGMPQGAN